jgi:hypothetical protein
MIRFSFFSQGGRVRLDMVGAVAPIRWDTQLALGWYAQRRRRRRQCTDWCGVGNESKLRVGSLLGRVAAAFA